MTISPDSKIYRSIIVLVYIAFCFTSFPIQIGKFFIFSMFSIGIWKNCLRIDLRSSRKQEVITNGIFAFIFIILILVFPYYEYPFLTSALVLLFFSLISYGRWTQYKDVAVHNPHRSEPQHQ